MEIEGLKRKNLTQERQLGKLEGDLDLIRLKGHLDDPKQVETMTTPTPRMEKTPGRGRGQPRVERASRRGKADNTNMWDKSGNLPPLSDPRPALERYRSKSMTGKYERFADGEDEALKDQIEARLPPISPTGQMTARSGPGSPVSPGRRSRKQYPGPSRERPKDKISTLHKGQPVMGFTESQAMAKMKHIARESSYGSHRENSLKTLDFHGVLPQAGSS
jgi:hypothetical protein